ncbi:hypothetical protein MMC16_001786 [Acarospora aff. strigata]|nr:hypothetical protein [Acarospora aff. strigata]
MPSRLAAPVVTVDVAKMHKVDTRNVENLFGMWTGETQSLFSSLDASDNPDRLLAVFSKCADSMEEGRRLENLSWRLWNRETFCCESQPQLATTPAIHVASSRPKPRDIPELSASVESVASDVEERMQPHGKPQTAPLNIRRPWIRRDDSVLSRSRGTEKHITSIGLEKMVISIKEKKDLEPLSPSIADTVPSMPSIATRSTHQPSPTLTAPRQSSDCSTSTAAVSSPESNGSATQTVGSDTSAELITSHSVIRGFSPGRSSSYRSHTNLAPTPVPAGPSAHIKIDLESKKKGGMFLLGGSSGEDESSFEERMATRASRSSLSDGLKRKHTSFRDEVEARTIAEGAAEDEEVFESDDDIVSESAIDDDDDESDWEDSATESGRSSVEEKQLFQRVDSKPTLTSRRSLLTTLMHQPQRAAALAAAASKSTPAMQRSRTSSPNGPSVAASPDDEAGLTMRGPDIPRSKPIIVTTSHTHPPALSPRTTRRNMLATELTESLRKHLLWERQQKSATANAVLKRRHTAQDVANLQDFPGQKPAQSSKDGSKNNSWNHYFDHGLQEYHQTGW